MRLSWLCIFIFICLVGKANCQPLSYNSSSTNHSFSLPGSAQTGRFYGSALAVSPSSNALTAANRLTATPFFLNATSLLKTLNFNITAGNAAAWNARICVYADTGSGLPGSLVADGGTIAVGSGSLTGVETATLGGGGITLGGPFWYWIGLMADSASESLSSIGNGAAGAISSSRLLGWSSVANITSSTTATGVYMAQTFGACPGTFSATPTFADGVPLPYIVLGF